MLTSRRVYKEGTSRSCAFEVSDLSPSFSTPSLRKRSHLCGVEPIDAMDRINSGRGFVQMRLRRSAGTNANRTHPKQLASCPNPADTALLQRAKLCIAAQ